MYIELLSKTCQWCGDKGVVMDIKARTYPRDLSTLSEQGALNTRNAGTTIGISISGLGEVTTSGTCDVRHGTSEDALHRNDLNGSVTSNWSGVMAIIQQWLVDSNLLQEWGEETRKYAAALSRVDLPCSPENVNGHYCNYLRYYLKMGEDGLYITAMIQVTEKHAVISAGLRDGDDKYDDNTSIGLYESTITGPVNTDTVKAAVSKVLDRLWDLSNTPLVKD
ncbi:hypothetical protein [Microcoleus phage My-WqHQDG]|nr:hypothetical protein [Microcoleus phage My-WqHQDG]